MNFWVKESDFETRQSRLKESTERLQNVLKNGTPAEKQEATRLDATVDLMESDFETRQSRLEESTERLQNVLENGTPAEKREATRLKAAISKYR